MGALLGRLIWIAALGALLFAIPARAAPYDDALARFAADSFADTEAGIEGVAASGNPLAVQVIEALQDARLAFDPQTRKVYIKDGSRLIDAATGQPVTEPAELTTVRINNRLRRAIEAALGGLTLLAPDPAKRLDAARAVLKSRDVAALPTLETAIGKETNPRVKAALTEARAAVVLYSADAKEADKLDAI